MINYVSNLPRELRSGGFSAINAAAFSVLNAKLDATYVGPIDPAILPHEKAMSVARRAIGLAGAFYFFSEARLERIARDVRSRCRADAAFDFFHGFTPWVRTQPPRPYLAWSDCTFRDYVDIYHQRARFRGDDLARIEEAEAAWTRAAAGIFFTTEWAARRAISQYGLAARNVGTVGLIGEVDAPDRDVYSDGRDFAFISTAFEAKGGPVVLAAFEAVRRRHPDISLVIVGDMPRRIGAWAGVTPVGFLRKEDPREYARYRHILAHSRALLHPTTRDIGPLVLIEAAFFGCPAISSRSHAIPELVENGHSGLLLEDPRDTRAVADAMQWMLEDEAGYRRMRHAAWVRARERHSRAAFEARLAGLVHARGLAGRATT